MIWFKRERLIEGMILHSRGQSFLARYTRRVLTRAARKTISPTAKCWGNHDALIIENGGQWYVGDAVFPRARMTPLEEWERAITIGEEQVRIFWPLCGSVRYGEVAAAWWVTNVEGRRYDWMALPLLALKEAMLISGLDQWIGLRWRWYCTEGVRDAWTSAVTEDVVYANPKPTPLTTEKRAGMIQAPNEYDNLITLRDITRGVMVWES